MALDGVNMAVTTSTMNGDDTGRMEVRPSQTLEITADRILQTTAILSQRESSVNLPPEFDCRGIDLYIRGKILSLTLSHTQQNCSRLLQTHSGKNIESLFE